MSFAAAMGRVLLGLVRERRSIGGRHVSDELLMNVVANLAVLARFGIEIFLQFTAQLSQLCPMPSETIFVSHAELN